ncbi:MAG TPA: radical SAM family heme chaperone HemW [Terracidiphilus sp.]|nr:radical SAM family heme chaperone HemW [Terracidiphilus sp.]
MQWMPDSALGVYVSIPFCRSKCTYCNFASGVYPASEHARYVDRLLADLAGAGNWAESIGAHLPGTVDTVYFGGGTPSLLDPALIRKLFCAIRACSHVIPDAEITVECAPGQLPQPTLEALAEAGVNRVSLGVQSFIDTEAHASGRLHSRVTVLDDLSRLRSAGISNINLDLIAGLAGQTFDSWNESLAVLLDTGVPHASVYMLEVDEDSRLGRELLSGGARYRAGLIPTDDSIARMYETAVERLATAGLVQYEISNFARPGQESRHNLRYWRRRPYLGLGLDASSALYAGDGFPGSSPDLLRATTTDELKAYLENTQPPETERLDVARRHEEAWFLGLRLNCGIDPADLAAEFGSDRIVSALDAASQLTADGLLETDGGRIRLTARGRLLSNEVFQHFLDLQPAASPVR